MIKTRVSKAYRSDKHIGFKKTVGGREWFLVYGITPADEAKAISLVEVLDAKWKLIKASGGTSLSQTDFEDAKLLIAGQPRWASARQPVSAMSAAELNPAPGAASGTASSPAGFGPAPAVTVGSTGRRWLYPAIDEFVATMKRSLKPDGSNGDHVFNTCERIMRARDAKEDTPLDPMEDWDRIDQPYMYEYQTLDVRHQEIPSHVAIWAHRH
jgi:hypothetical protein